MGVCSGDDEELESAAASATRDWCPGTITSQVGPHPGSHNSPSQLLRAYDLGRTARALHSRGFKRIALQFPDALLPHSFFVCAALEAALRMLPSDTDAAAGKPLVFILGDTSYGECCVDEVAAQHIDADIVVHYGNACLSPTRALPVLYVFPQLPMAAETPGAADVQFAAQLSAQVERVRSLSPEARKVVVLYDIELYRDMDCWKNIIAQSGSDCGRVEFALPRVDVGDIVEPLGDTCGEKRPVRASACSCENSGDEVHAESSGGDSPLLQAVTSAVDSVVVCGPLSFSSHRNDSTAGGSNAMVMMPSDDERHTAFLWVSRVDVSPDRCIPLRNAALQYTTTSCAGFYVAATGSAPDCVEPVNVGRLLGKRYALVDKAREAERVGIVAGTLGVSGNLAVIERVKKVVEAAGRRWYMLMVGKPNAAKLGNFAEMDVFVLVACAQNSIIDSKEYLRPIVTPFEIEVALGGRDWFSSTYSPDFADVLRVPLEIADANIAAPDTASGEPRLEVSARGDWSVSVGGAGGAAEFLASREWRGLDARHDGDGTKVHALPTRATTGRSGVAGSYDGEG